MLVLIVSYLLLVFLLPVALSLLVSYRALHQGNDCPHCRGDTIRLEAPRLELATRLNPFSVLHRRWCLCCGWEGTTRLARRGVAVAAGSASATTPGTGAWRADSGPGASPHSGNATGGTADRARPAGPGMGPGAVEPGRKPKARPGEHARDAATQTLDVRSLDVNGAAWRVMLQCWRSTDLYFGRFIFVGPSGRLWLDAVESFSGCSETEVLDQAQSLPDGTLTGRLRRLVGD